MGHDARAWAGAGFSVSGFDIAPSAVRLADEATRAAGLNGDFRVADFLNDTPDKPFDWLFEHTLFCAIQPGERDAYVRAVLRWLKPGGFYLAVNYFIPDVEGPPFGTTREEIWARFSPHLELLEDWVPRSYPNRTGLERMFWWKRPSPMLRIACELLKPPQHCVDLSKVTEAVVHPDVGRVLNLTRAPQILQGYQVLARGVYAASTSDQV